MITQVREVLRKLRGCASGNATLLVALAMPALIGATGYAVDTAQWYMWKRELQFATDQAALAGAWARASESTRATYETRATQEFDNNLAATSDYASTPNIRLADYAGGDDNSVIVSASVTRMLPFSSIIIGTATTVAVSSQATYAAGTNYTSCLIAVDEDADGAITIGGNSVLTAGCGMAALSTSDTSITVNGNPTIDAGWIISAGGIDDWFDSNTNDTVMENMDGLFDPFADLSPPSPANSQVARTYSCPNGQVTTTADVTTSASTTYSYYKGANQNNANPYPSYSPQQAGGSSSSGPTNQTVANGTTAGTQTNTGSTWTHISGNGSNRIWEVATTTTTTTYANVVVTTGAVSASLQPGTYTNLKLKCDTVFTTGVYIIDGGDLDIAAQYTVTGSGVMFVLKNGAGISINGGSNINLTAMTVSELEAQGISSSQAELLAGMLVFEDRDSPGSTKNKINGNASTVLNGTIYLPVSNISFQGTASVTSQCLMIAAATITITGTANMTTFCPAGSSEDTTVAEVTSAVRLVA